MFLSRWCEESAAVESPLPEPASFQIGEQDEGLRHCLGSLSRLVIAEKRSSIASLFPVAVNRKLITSPRSPLGVSAFTETGAATPT